MNPWLRHGNLFAGVACWQKVLYFQVRPFGAPREGLFKVPTSARWQRLDDCAIRQQSDLSQPLGDCIHAQLQRRPQREMRLWSSLRHSYGKCAGCAFALLT